MTELPVLIPAGFTTAITPGKVVIVGEKLAQFQTVSEEVINLAEKLEIHPSKVAKMLKVNPGDSVEIGEVLAIKSGLFSSVQVRCKVAGKIMRYERDSGKLIVAPKHGDGTASIGDTISSPVEGTVIDVQPTQIVIKTDKNVFPATRGTGKAVSGEICLVEGKKDEDLLYRLDSEAIGRIVVSEKVTREMLMKALGIGVSGIITTDIWEPDLMYFKEKEKSVPLVLLDKDVFEMVKKHKEKKVFVNGNEKVVVLLR